MCPWHVQLATDLTVCRVECHILFDNYSLAIILYSVSDWPGVLGGGFYPGSFLENLPGSSESPVSQKYPALIYINLVSAATSEIGSDWDWRYRALSLC